MEVSELLSVKKREKYYNRLAQKLADSSTSSKTYWSSLKTFYNNKKIPLIPPLLTDKLESDFKKKVNHFRV